jgi:hypothetical protein
METGLLAGPSQAMDAELPPPNTIRWVARRKAAVVAADPGRQDPLLRKPAVTTSSRRRSSSAGSARSTPMAFGPEREAPRSAFRVIVVTPSRGLDDRRFARTPAARANRERASRRVLVARPRRDRARPGGGNPSTTRSGGRLPRRRRRAESLPEPALSE